MSENDTEVQNDQPEEDLAAPHTPNYNEESDADRYPDVIPSPIPAHTVFKGDPQIDGPYLDDVREAQADARRRAEGTVADIQRRKADEGQQLLSDIRDANKKLTDLNSGGEPTQESVSPDDETVVGEDGGPTGNNDGETVNNDNVTPLNSENEN